MNIFVTGCAGYIGATLCDLLTNNADNEVVGIDNLMYDNQTALHHLLSRPNFTFRQEDVRDFDEYKKDIRNADVVIPLAALVGAPLCEQEQFMARHINYQMVVALVDRLSKHQRILYPNTNSGYGTTSGEQAVDEQYPLNPISIYGQTKCAAEKVVLSHPNSVVLRLATVYGVSPRMRFDLLVNDFFRRLYYDKSLTIFEPKFYRSIVHVKDVARAFEFCMSPTVFTGGVYNVVSANYMKDKLANEIALYLGSPDTAIVVGEGEDPDKRNYMVSSKQLLKAGFEYKHADIWDSFAELEAMCSLYKKEQTMKMGNA